MPDVELHGRILRNPVIHTRIMRGGTGQPEISITEGPVETAVNEIVRDLTYKCRAVVRRGPTTRPLDGGPVVRAEFEVDIKIQPDRRHPDDVRTCTWDHVITTPARPYRRLPEDRERDYRR